MHERVFISLGSNMGDRSMNLARAWELLSRKSRVVARSSVYETQPVDFTDQPWFLNQVVELQTGLEPHRLLSFMQGVELELGRTRMVSKGQRVADLDLIFYGGRVINDAPGLIVPHPRAHLRRFVLVPMVELHPEFIHPVEKRTVKWLLEHLPKANDEVRLFKRAK